MRSSVLAGIVIATLSLAACSEQPTEVQNRPEPPPSGPQAVTGVPCTITLNELIDLAAKLIRPSPQLTTIVNALKALPKKPQDRLSAAVRKAAFAIIDLVSKAYAAGKLVKSPDTPANVLAFIQGMYCFVGMTPPTYPSGTIDPNEFAFAVITQTSGQVDVVPPSKHGGFRVAPTSLPVNTPATTVVAFKIEDDFSALVASATSGPLLTSLDQYPFFYEFNASPDVTFTKDVIAGVCPSDYFPVVSPLRLAHNVGANWGDVEILPAAAAPFLNCSDLGSIGSLRGLRGLFASVFLPTQLHAASNALVTVTTGGTLSHLSPFGSVDQGSNPANINFNPDEETFSNLTAPPGGPVFPPPSVVVRSRNGTPIAKVPVKFDVGETGGLVNGGTTATVSTNAQGVATVTSWTLGAEPGTYTLTATPRAVAQAGSPGSPPYRPAAEFSPLFLTFTATAVDQPGIISNETISLGVNREGQLDALVGTDRVGLRFEPTGSDGIAHGCPCEGWGVAQGEVSGYANQSQSPTTSNLVLESFTRTATEATSVVRVGSILRVTHHFHPTEVTPNLYQIDVTVENISEEPLSDVIYRRVVDWDIAPTPFSEFVTVVRSATLTGVEASNNGFASADPLTDRGEIPTGSILPANFNIGPSDQGAVFDLTLSTIYPSGTNTFVIYYGAAADPSAAKETLRSVGVAALSLARPNVSPFDGTAGNTFVLGFTGLGGDPVEVTEMEPPLETPGAGLRVLREPSGPDPRNR